MITYNKLRIGWEHLRPMPKRIAIASHLSEEELYTHYRDATEAVERSHYQIIWLLATGKTALEVSQVTGYSRIWIYQLVRRYNEHGPEGVGDLRHGNSGKKPLLTDEQQALVLASATVSGTRSMLYP